MDASAKEGGKITFPEILDIFISAIGRYLCSRSRFLAELYNFFLNRVTWALTWALTWGLTCALRQVGFVCVIDIHAECSDCIHVKPGRKLANAQIASQNLSMLPLLTVRSTRYDSVNLRNSNMSSLAIIRIYGLSICKITKNISSNRSCTNILSEICPFHPPMKKSLRQTKPKQPEPIVIPPFPDVVCGVKIDKFRLQAYQEGKFISIGICDPGGVVPLTHWIWYDFDK